MNHRTVARVALGYLTLSTTQLGLWALVAPRSFYDDFPGFGRTWIAIDGPFNEHFVRDFGALNLALAVLLAATFMRPTRDLLYVSAGAVVVWGVPHLVYHLANTDGLDTVDLIASLGGLVLYALLGLVLASAGRRASVEPEVSL